MTETEYDEAGKKPEPKFHVPCLLNKSEVRKLALRCGEKRLGWMPTRVSAEFIDDVESKVRSLVMKAVASHRSVGKTIKDFQ
jgi:hypothetical protein